MQYHNVDLNTFATVLPPVVMTSDELEAQLAPVYQRLHLPEGRLELMTGIRERRFWREGTMPGQVATQAAQAAIKQSGLPLEAIQMLIFCGVSRDCVEPATSTAVVRQLGLPLDTLNFDISNACLGVVSGILTLANAIEAGQIDCGIAVTGENAGPLVRHTIQRLNNDNSLTRKSIKNEFASLTIGSAAAAVIVTRRGAKLPPGHQLLAIATASDCRNNDLCQGDAAGGMTDGSQPVMQTDSHELMVQGIEVADRMWRGLISQQPWGDGVLPELVCGHQVGKVHRDLLFQRLGLPVDIDFPVFPEFGNCGSASLPMACALAAERGALKEGMALALLGIGSGINSVGMAVRW